MISNLSSLPIVSYGSEASPQAAKAAALPQVGADLEVEGQTLVRRPPVKIAQNQSFEQLQTLSPEQRQQLLEVKRREGSEARDQTKGRFAGAKNYHAQVGANGHYYVTAGWIPLELSPVPNDPAGTVAKMRAVRRAALTPLESGDADRELALNADRAILSAKSNMVEAELKRDVELSIGRNRMATRKETVASLMRMQAPESTSQPLAMNDDLSTLLERASTQVALESYMSFEAANNELGRAPGSILSLVA